MSVVNISITKGSMHSNMVKKNVSIIQWVIVCFSVVNITFLDPRSWPEGSYELGFVLPSVLLSGSFLGICWLVILKLCMVLGAQIEMCVTERNFLGKILFRQKWPQMIKGNFRKIYSLVLSGNSVEWKYLWLFSILRKLHRWEKSSTQVMAGNAVGQSDFSVL